MYRVVEVRAGVHSEVRTSFAVLPRHPAISLRAQTHAGRQCPTLRGWLSPRRAQRRTGRCLTPAPRWNSALLGHGSRAFSPHNNPLSKA